MKTHSILVLVTRPQASGSELAQKLRSAGAESLWWPAFDLLAPENPAELKARLARLEDFDLVIFVSPAAVHAFGARFRRMPGRGTSKSWPPGTWLAAVGTATREAAIKSLPGLAQARIICPEGDNAADGGSEALIAAIQAAAIRPHSALVVRAQSGRRRLLEWLRGRGVAVEEVVAYQRVVHEPDAQQWAAVRAAVDAGTRLAVMYTSTEAVAVVAAQFESDTGLADALADAISLCVHERIEQALRARGRTDIRRCGMDADSILQALRAGQGPVSPAPEVDLLL
jgi:uroporphyrinogen-III synthase